MPGEDEARLREEEVEARASAARMVGESDDELLAIMRAGGTRGLAAGYALLARHDRRLQGIVAGGVGDALRDRTEVGEA